MCGNGVWEPTAGEDCDTNTTTGVCGAPGSPAACRFVCSTGITCPTGRLCGDDGICRLPVRRFVPAVDSPHPSVGTQLSLADLDGDGLPDIIGTNPRGAVVQFGAPSATFAGSRTLATGTPTGRITTARLGASDRRDIVSPAGGGIQLHRVEAQREIRPIAQAGIDLRDLVVDRTVRTAVLRFAGVSDLLLALVENATGGFVATAPGEQIALVSTAFPGDLDVLAGIPAAGDTNGDGTEELAIAFEGASTVRVFELRCPGGRSVTDCGTPLRFDVLATIELGRDTVEGGVAFADADGDGAPDVFIGTNTALLVARNRRDGTFAPPVIDPRIGEYCADACRWPLAIQDLDGDGAADFVTDAAIVTTSSAGAIVRHVLTDITPRGWSFATVGDFDDDGYPDVALARAGRYGIEIAYGSDAPRFNDFLLDTLRPVGGIQSGDFDGDGFDDLAIIGLATDEDSVAIAYGKPEEVGSPIEMARFGAIDRVIPGFLRSQLGDAPDFRTDLVVEASNDGVRRVALLIGTPEEQMISPLILGTIPRLRSAPRALAAGTFDSTSDRDDIVALTDGAIWLVPSDESGALRLDLASTIAATIIGDASDVLLESAQLDDDPFTEIIVVTGAYPSVAPGDAIAPRMYLLDVGDDHAIEVTEVALPPEVFAPSSLEIRSHGADTPSILLSFVGRQTANASPTGGIVIYPTSVGRIAQTPIVVRARDPAQRILAATAANIDSDRRIELLVLTEDGVVSVEQRDEGYLWGPGVPLGDPSRAPSAFGVMRAEDFDRDGLLDLVIANEAGLFVYRAIDRLEGFEP